LPTALNVPARAVLSTEMIGTSGMRTSTDEFAVTGCPLGADEVTVATLVTMPASTFACVTVCEAAHEMVCPPPRLATGSEGVQVPMIAVGSLNVTFDKAAVPVFEITITYGIASPTAGEVGTLGVVFEIPMAATGVATDADAERVAPPMVVAFADAEFVYEPERSATTTVWEAGQVIVAPAARDATGSAGVQTPSVAVGSVMVTFDRADVPVLVATTL
jgi:hypothetical protein